MMQTTKLYDAISEPIPGIRQDTLIFLILGLILLVFIGLRVLRALRSRRSAAKPEETKKERRDEW